MFPRRLCYGLQLSAVDVNRAVVSVLGGVKLCNGQNNSATGIPVNKITCKHKCRHMSRPAVTTVCIARFTTLQHSSSDVLQLPSDICSAADQLLSHLVLFLTWQAAESLH